MTTLALRFVSVLALLPVVGPQAAGQNRWEVQVRGHMARAHRQITDRGFSLVYDPIVGSARQGSYQDYTIRLRRNQSYVIAGVCDNDCSDLDFSLFDETGHLVASDVEHDDYPVISREPFRTANYTLRVTMASCRTGVCWFGAGIYSQD